MWPTLRASSSEGREQDEGRGHEGVVELAPRPDLVQQVGKVTLMGGFLQCKGAVCRAGSGGSDVEVLMHHTVSVSNFQSIEVLTDDRMVHFWNFW